MGAKSPPALPFAVPLTALIVDDEPLARQELAYLLEAAEGVNVIGHGSNGIEAVELIRTHKPDVVFLDVQMPGLDGFAVLKKLLDKKTDLPQVVFATAFDQYAVRAFEVNAVDYLLKPFDRKRVLKTIDKKRPTLFPAVPTIYTAISNHPDLAKYDVSSIRFCMSGGAPLLLDVKQRFERLTGCTLVEGYGLSETSPVASATRRMGSTSRVRSACRCPERCSRSFQPRTA